MINPDNFALNPSYSETANEHCASGAPRVIRRCTHCQRVPIKLTRIRFGSEFKRRFQVRCVCGAHANPEFRPAAAWDKWNWSAITPPEHRQEPHANELST